MAGSRVADTDGERAETAPFPQPSEYGQGRAGRIVSGRSDVARHSENTTTSDEPDQRPNPTLSAPFFRCIATDVRDNSSSSTAGHRRPDDSNTPNEFQRTLEFARRLSGVAPSRGPRYVVLPELPFPDLRSEPLRRSPRWLVLAVALWAAPGPHAQFREPELLSAPDATVEHYAMGIDHFSILHVAMVANGRLELRSRSGDLDSTVPLAAGADSPALEFFPTGLQIVYVRNGPDPAIMGRQRLGAALSSPRRISPPGSPVAAPSVTIDGSRRPVTTWTEPLRGLDGIWASAAGRVPTMRVRGRSPTIETDHRGRAVVFFERGGTIYRWRQAEEGVQLPTPLVTGVDPGSPLGSGSFDGTTYLLFRREGALVLADDRLGDFQPRTLTTEPAQDAYLKVTPSGLVAVTYATDGDIYYVVGNAFFLADPAAVTETPDVEESQPAIDGDSFANVFVTFLREGQLFVTTTASEAQARFRPTPERGEVPLEVEFRDESSGQVTGWRWDFGDGTTSVQQHPSHTYTETGEYLVRLEVTGPGGVSALTHEETVLVTDRRNRMWIANTRAFPGQGNVHVPVMVTNDAGAQGFQIAARYDPRVVEIQTIDFDHSNIGTLEAELQVFNVSVDPEDPFVVAGTLLDVEPPFDRRTLPAGNNQRLANIVVDVSSNALPNTTTEITLENQVGRPPINNILVVDARTVVPALGDPGTLLIDEVTFPPPRFFVRGDADDSGRVAISDAISILNFLFVGDEPLGCEDALDASDDGAIDISDSLVVLNFLFRGGGYLLPPYPESGLDPTQDELVDCPSR